MTHDAAAGGLAASSSEPNGGTDGMMTWTLG